MTDKIIRVGGASGYWGDSSVATPQLLKAGDLDYITYDYLAEVTMSIMARARAKDADKGYATDFVDQVMAQNLPKIAAQGVKILSNAGGVNPEACGRQIRDLVAKLGLDLNVAVVSGDDMTAQAADFAKAGVTEMFTGDGFPEPGKVASVNAYLGAWPIVAALKAGADIVITGRCADSALTLAAAAYEFGWAQDAWDALSGGSLAGHILECGCQATGGNFTDWRLVADDLDNIGYPIADIAKDGSFVVRKPEGRGGLVSIGTVAEQLLYEIGNPRAYILPDVVCDFADVTLEQVGADRVRVANAKGHAATDSYKVSATWADGWRAGVQFAFTGFDAADKARVFADATLKRCSKVFKRMQAPDYFETSVEITGDGSVYGAAPSADARDVMLKMAVRHIDPRAAGLVLRETTGLALNTPAGLTVFNAGRPKPMPVVRLFSFLVDKDKPAISITLDGEPVAPDGDLAVKAGGMTESAETVPVPGIDDNDTGKMTMVPLIKLAWARSGDKGDKANIGVIARQADYLPWIARSLTPDRVLSAFQHFNPSGATRYYLPGSHALNFLLDDVLGGGGVASLRNDPQAKAYAQILLHQDIEVPAALAKAL